MFKSSYVLLEHLDPLIIHAYTLYTIQRGVGGLGSTGRSWGDTCLFFGTRHRPRRETADARRGFLALTCHRLAYAVDPAVSGRPPAAPLRRVGLV